MQNECITADFKIFFVNKNIISTKGNSINENLHKIANPKKIPVVKEYIYDFSI
jgi:hypothetical protein